MSGKVVVVEARQVLLGLEFKTTVKKVAKPVSTQIKVYSNEDQNQGEQRL